MFAVVVVKLPLKKWHEGVYEGVQMEILRHKIHTKGPRMVVFKFVLVIMITRILILVVIICRLYYYCHHFFSH